MSDRREQPRPESSGLVHPRDGESPADQELLDALWAWFMAATRTNNVLSGLPVAHGRVVKLMSVWSAEDGRSFTCSLRAKDKGKSTREWVLYTTSTSPWEAMRRAVAASEDEATQWKEQTRRAEAHPAGGIPDLPQIL
jgi:hypothetical protein